MLLGRHPAIIAPQELFLLLFSSYDEWRRQRPLAIASLIESLALLGRTETAEGLDQAWSGRSVADLYDWLLGLVPPGTHLLDKTPAYATYPTSLETSRRFEPFYVWLIRHPLGAVDSYLRVKAERREGARRFLRRVKDVTQRWILGGMSRKGRRREDLWVRQNRNIRDFLAAVPPERQRTLAFENLLERPESEMRRLLDGIGLPFEPAMLDRPARGMSVIPGLGDPNFGRYQDISRSPVEIWRRRYREAALSGAAARLLNELWRPLRAAT